MTEAKTLLRELNAIDTDGRITGEGTKLRRLPLPPRLARMVVDAAVEGEAGLAAEIAVLIGERGLGGDDIDLRARLDGLHRDRSPRSRDAHAMAKRWSEIAHTFPSPHPGRAIARPSASLLGEGWEGGRAETHSRDRSTPTPSPQGGGEHSSIGALLAFAYPERIAKNRGGAAGTFLLVNGRGANVDQASVLAREPFLAVAEMTGTAAQSRILLAAPITPEEIETRFADKIQARDDVTFDIASASLRGRRSRRLGAIALSERPIPVTGSDESAQKLAEGITRLGIARLPWTKALKQWRDRVMFLRASEGEEWPDLSDAALTTSTNEWLTPALAGKTALGEFSADEFDGALAALLPWPLKRRLDTEAPTHFEAPTGSQVSIDYEVEGGPKIAIRVQELFGLDRHPAIAGGKVPLLIELLSPAHRPVQMTRDLPGFWRGSYAAVRTEMRGRYPRHPWPDNPIAAAPTRRAKPRA
jgi:ATP-dependent helicase HrpB